MKKLALVFLLTSTACTTTLVAQVIPDHKNQAISKGIAFMPDMGQVADTDHDPVLGMEYASTGNPLQLFLLNGPEFGFVHRKLHADTSVQDTTFRVDMWFIGENTQGNVSATPYLETTWYHNYYLPQCPAGVTGIHGNQYLVYEDVYPNIDVHVTSNAWGYKFYFVVRPGGDPNDIRMRFSGQDELEVDVLEGLRMLLENEWIRIPQAIAYQIDGNTTIGVPWTVGYQEVTPDLVVRLQFGEYDPTKTLVFDISENTPLGGTPPLPTPEWGTYYNGLDVGVSNAARTSDGGMVTCGASESWLFPLTGGVTTPTNGGADAFYTRFTNQYHMEYSTYIGGVDFDEALGVAELNGDVIVTGQTESSDGFVFEAPQGGFIDDILGSGSPGWAGGTCWLARFNEGGVRDWMTLFGPNFALKPANVDFDNQGNIYLAGTVVWGLPWYGPLPVEFTDQPTANSMPICGTGFSQSQMGFANWDFGPGEWRDGFTAQFNSGCELERSSLFAGSSYIDEITDMEVERNDGTMFIVGRTFSPQGSNPLCTGTAEPEDPGFPWCPGAAQDPYFVPGMPPNVHHEGMESGFLAQIKSSGDLLYCSSIGTPDEISGLAAVTVSNGRVTVVGNTANDTYNPGCSEPPIGFFPRCNPQGGNQFTFPFFTNGNSEYWFIMQFQVATWNLVWSSSLGDLEPVDVSADALGNVYVVGMPGNYAELPLLAHPDYYSSTLPGTNENTIVLGFDQTGQFWGSFHGKHYNRFAVASRANDRIYIAGGRGNTGFVPYNCPWGVEDPWCVEQAAVSGIAYSQLKETLPVAIDEPPRGIAALLTCYPNPTGTTITFSGLPGREGPQLLTVTDASGRGVAQEALLGKAGTLAFDVAHLAPGHYTAVIRSAHGGTSVQAAFVVQP